MLQPILNPITGEPDEGLKRKRTRAKKDAQRQLESDYQQLMSTKWGRRLMWEWLSRAGIYQSSFTTHSGQMAFNEGRRNFGLELVGDLTNFTPIEFDEMHKENRPADRAHQLNKRNDHTESESDAEPES